MSNPHKILGIEPGASEEEISKAFRRKAKDCHPDTHPNDPQAEEAFKKLTKARDALLHPERQPDDGYSRDQSPFSDIFNSVYGNVFRREEEDILGRVRRGQRVGEDVHHELWLTLEEAVGGCKKTDQTTRLVKCETCNGQGGFDEEACSYCDGKGRIEKQDQFFRIAQTCFSCAGRGSQYKRKCQDCKGNGRIPKVQTVGVHLKAGTFNGYSLRKKGGGNEGKDGGLPGDFYIHVRVLPHTIFEPGINNTLQMDLPIDFTVAALGATIEVPTLLWGKEKLTVPAGSQYGDMLRMPGRGLTQAGVTGDQIVRLLIIIPKSLSDKQREILTKYVEVK